MKRDIDVLGNLEKELLYDSQLYRSYGYTDPTQHGGEEVWERIAENMTGTKEGDGPIARQLRQTFGPPTQELLRPQYRSYIRDTEKKETRESVLLLRQNLLERMLYTIDSIRSVLARVPDGPETISADHHYVEPMQPHQYRDICQLEEEMYGDNRWSTERVRHEIDNAKTWQKRVHDGHIARHENNAYARITKIMGEQSTVVGYIFAVRRRAMETFQHCSGDKHIMYDVLEIQSAGFQRQNASAAATVLLNNILQHLTVVHAMELKDGIAESHA